MTKDKWVWMPHAGHLCVGNWCRFKLNTYVGNYIVSTVGEYFPDAPVREILAESRKIQLEGIGDDRANDFRRKIGYEEIGSGRLYETMVFQARKSGNIGRACCPYEPTSFENIDFEGYNTPEEALKGHMKLCAKWANKPKQNK